MTSRAHGLVISLTLGAASTVAAYAVIVTGNVAEGTTKPEVATEQAIAARARKLDAWEASLRKALSSRPPAVPAKARYASVVLMSPPGSMALPTPVAVPPRPASEVVAVTVPHTALPPVSHPKPARASRPRAVAPTPPRREDDDRDAGGNLVPVQVAAPQPVQAAAVAPAAIQSAPVAPPAPAPSAKTSAEQQCRTILQAAENQSEKVKQAAEAQCEALKQAAERTG